MRVSLNVRRFGQTELRELGRARTRGRWRSGASRVYGCARPGTSALWVNGPTADAPENRAPTCSSNSPNGSDRVRVELLGRGVGRVDAPGCRRSMCSVRGSPSRQWRGRRW